MNKAGEVCCPYKRFWRLIRKFAESNLYKDAKKANSVCKKMKETIRMKPISWKLNLSHVRDFTQFCTFNRITKGSKDMRDYVLENLKKFKSGYSCPVRVLQVEAMNPKKP